MAGEAGDGRGRGNAPGFQLGLERREGRQILSGQPRELDLVGDLVACLSPVLTALTNPVKEA